MPLREIGQADDGVERRAHVVRHIAEKTLLGDLVLTGDLQSVLQQAALAQFALLFLLHFLEAEHHFLRGQRFIEEYAHAHPAHLVAEAAQKVAAEVAHALGYQIADVLRGKVLQKVLVGVRLDDLARRAQKIVIGAGRRYALAHIVRALDHLVGIRTVVHAVERVIGVAQHAHRLVGTLDALADAHIPPGHAGDQEQKQCDHHDQAHLQPGEIAEYVAVRDGDDGVPAIAQTRVVNGARLAVEIADVEARAVHFPGGNACDEAIEVCLHFLAWQLDAGIGVDDLPPAVAEKEGIARFHAEVVELEAYVFRQNIEGHHRVGVGALLGDGDNRLVVDDVHIQVGEDDLAIGGDSALVPFGALHVVALVPRPWMSSDDLAIEHHVGVNYALAEHRIEAGEVDVRPLKHLFVAPALFRAIVDGGCSESEQRFVHRQAALLLRGVVSGHGSARFPGVAEQRRAYERYADHGDDDQRGKGDKIEAHAGKNALKARPLASIHHAQTSRMAPVTRA